MERARLVESRGTVQDFKFAPKHMGLKMVCSLITPHPTPVLAPPC